MKYLYILLLLVVVFAISWIFLTNASGTMDLSTASNFAVLGASTVTNTGPSVINGDLGLSPGTSVTGFPPGVLNGTQDISDAVAIQAQTDLTGAYTFALGQAATTIPTELGSQILVAGTYDSPSGTFGLTGNLTLDGQGDPASIFIFKTASTLITAGASSVTLINGAQACNVYWQVGSSATLGAGSTFKGSILALTSVTLTTGANVEGRVLAQNGAVTLDTNIISKPTCTVAPPPEVAPSSTASSTITGTVTPTTTPTFPPTGGGSMILVPNSPIPTTTTLPTPSPTSSNGTPLFGKPLEGKG